MRTWPALIVAPLLALSDQGVAYVMAGWGCAHQQQIPLHLVHAGFFLATMVLTVVAAREARTGLRQLRGDAGFTTERRDFLSVSATMVGALSAATIAAIWIPQWFLSACYA